MSSSIALRSAMAMRRDAPRLMPRSSTTSDVIPPPLDPGRLPAGTLPPAGAGRLRAAEPPARRVRLVARRPGGEPGVVRGGQELARRLVRPQLGDAGRDAHAVPARHADVAGDGRADAVGHQLRPLGSGP